ncbi:MAG TPA: hypothetical protein VNK49_04715 [Anaerolineales bacterium]|nr:hypothetical protein [Anaerolineales bacterium]
MENRQTFDRSLLVPIFLGGFSLFGIALVLLLGRLNAARIPAPVSDTPTPFTYLFLGTEPGIFTPSPEVTETPPGGGPDVGRTLHPRSSPTATFPDLTDTPINLFFPTPTLTPIPTQTPTLPPVLTTYDDTDFRFIYEGNWISQSNVPGVYQGTLHVSGTIGDTLTFTFLGQQMKLQYQAGPSLGTITITLDNLGFNLDQSSETTEIKEWVSGVLVQGTHTVLITHSSGGSVNIDAVIIPEISTPTPTLTPTE